MLMEEILHHLGYIYIYIYVYINLVNNGINYLPTSTGEFTGFLVAINNRSDMLVARKFT